MNSRERLITALENGRPDRLPCQMHGWMPYYLKKYLAGIDQWGAYEKFDMDYVLYMAPGYTFDEKDQANWQVTRSDVITKPDGIKTWQESVETPKGTLLRKIAANAFTQYETEHLIKDEADFKIWNEYFAPPTGVDLTELKEAKERLKDKGIIRTFPTYCPGQPSPWQALCISVGTEKAIMWAITRLLLMNNKLKLVLLTN